MNFISAEHKGRFEDLMSRGRGISINDIERVAPMYLMSANVDLFYKANDLYDFAKGEFIVDVIVDNEGNLKAKFKESLSSSERRMMLLAFDMYSGNDNVSVNELFSCLDSNNREIVLRAIAMRY